MTLPQYLHRSFSFYLCPSISAICRDKAGAYGIQSEGGSFVKGIRGCYYNVVGFPLNHFARRFRQIVLALKG